MMLKTSYRRHFLKAALIAPFLWANRNLSAVSKTQMRKSERIKRTLAGERVDRPPFTFWHRVDLKVQPAEKHAEAALEFFRKFDVDVLKVMGDYPYPLPDGIDKIKSPEDWLRFEPLKNPFPEQIKALRLIKKELKGEAPFVETILQSWTVVEGLSPKTVFEELKRDPKALKKVLRVVSESQANHAREALEAGASGIFLAVAAADSSVMEPQEYVRMVRESDLMILEAVREKSSLNILHVHGKRPHWETLITYPVHVLNYSLEETGVSLEQIRRRFTGTVMGGLSEGRIATQSDRELAEDVASAVSTMQNRRLILSPGCSVPIEIAESRLNTITQLLTHG